MRRLLAVAGIAARTLFVYTCVFGWTTILFLCLAFPVAVLERLAGREQADLGALVLGRFVWLTSLPLRMVARVKLDRREALPEGRAVVVCNHHSIADLYWLFHLYPRIFFVARRSLFRVPIVGWGAWLLGQIPLDEDAGEAMRRARRVLDRGRSVVLFPEGTRYPEGTVGPFRRGAFRLAQETTGLVQPVVVAGTGRVWPRGRWYFRILGPMGMRVLPARRIPAGLGRRELDARIEEIRAEMVRERARLARELGLEEGGAGVEAGRNAGVGQG